MPTYSLKAKRKIIDEPLIARISLCVICASLFTYGFCFPIIDELVAGAFMAVFAIVEFIRQKYIPVDFAFFLLVETMLCVALIEFHTSETYMHKLQWAIVLPLGYILGKAMVGEKKNADRRTLMAYASLATGMFAQGVLDYTYGFFQVTELNASECYFLQFWSRDYETKNALEIEFMLTISALGLAIYLYKKNKLLSLLILLANVFIQICAAFTRGRGPVVYALAALLLFAIIYLYDRRLKLGKREKKIFIALSLTIAILVIIAVIIVEYRFFGLIEINGGSYWFRDGGIFHNVRFEMDIEGLKLLLLNPLGGYDVTDVEIYYQKSHSMWTEYGREWGFVPFILLSLYSVAAIIDVVRLALRRDISPAIKYTLCISFAILNLNYAMEPTAHSRRHFLLFALFISGMIRRQLEIKSAE